MKTKSKQIVTYDLWEMPTTFHAAGLAGAVFACQLMKEQHGERDNPLVEFDGCTATFHFTESSVISLMDWYYDSMWTTKVRKVDRNNKKAKKTNALTVPILGQDEVIDESNPKMVKRQFKERVPQHFLMRLLTGLSREDAVKWLLSCRRKALVEQLRVEKARQFICLADDPDAHVSWGAKLWDGISKSKNLKSRGYLSLGAGKVDFDGETWQEHSEMIFLLHFWSLVCMHYKAEFALSHLSKSKKGQGNGKSKPQKRSSFFIVVPHPCNIEEFIYDYRDFLARIVADSTSLYCYWKPMYVPLEAGMTSVRSLCENKLEASMPTSLSGVNVYLAEKPGNALKISQVQDMPLSSEKCWIFNTVQDMGYKNPVLRTTLEANAVYGRPWWTGIDLVFHAPLKDVVQCGSDFKKLLDSRERSMQVEADKLIKPVRQWLRAYITRSTEDAGYQKGTIEYYRKAANTCGQLWYNLRALDGQPVQMIICKLLSEHGLAGRMAFADFDILEAAVNHKDDHKIVQRIMLMELGYLKESYGDRISVL